MTPNKEELLERAKKTGRIDLGPNFSRCARLSETGDQWILQRRIHIHHTFTIEARTEETTAPFFEGRVGDSALQWVVRWVLSGVEGRERHA